jgi:hypothetical protein
MRQPKAQVPNPQSKRSTSRTRGMNQALPIGGAASLIIHGGLLFFALYAWQVAPRIMPEDVISVDMVDDTQSTIGEGKTPETLAQGIETPTPAPLPQQTQPSVSEALPDQSPPPPAPLPLPQEAPTPSPKQATASAPPLLPPTASPPPAPKSLPAPTAKALPQTAAKTATQPPPRATPLPIPKPLPATAPPKAASKPLILSARPNAAPPARAGPRQAAPAAPPEFDLAAASAAATGADSGGRRTPQLAARGREGRLGAAGGGTKLTGDLEAALRRQIQPCWLEPADMSNPRRLLVEVSIDLGLDGRLLRDPVLVTPSSRAGADASLVVAIDNALRAVRQCAPFNLPPDRYESWRQVRFSFDPRRMSGTP